MAGAVSKDAADGYARRLAYHYTNAVRVYMRVGRADWFLRPATIDRKKDTILR